METKCATAGCFNTADDRRLCGECQCGDTPIKRGKVTNRELLYARQYGGRDAIVTEQRLIDNGQPTDGLHYSKDK